MTLIKSCHLFAKSVSECVRGRLTITRHIKREMKRGTVAVVLHDFVCTRSEHHSRHTGLTVHTQSTVNVWNISTLTSLGSASGFCVQNVASYFQWNTPCLSRHFKLLWDLKTIYLTCFFFTNSNWLSIRQNMNIPIRMIITYAERDQYDSDWHSELPGDIRGIFH